MGQTSRTDQVDELDRVERQIDIDASAERVWGLIARPGWYINQGAVVSNPVLETDGDLTVLRHPEHGDFRLKTVRLDPPGYAAFRWLGDGGESTLVEFWITERDDAGVTLRVAESGFSSLGDDPADWLRKREENVEGWEQELAAAAAYLDRGSVQRAVDVAAPPDRVWSLITTPDGLAAWYAFDGATVEPEVGGRISFHWTEHGTYLGRVTAYEEPSRFGYRMAATPDTEPAEGSSTEVLITVQASGTGSTVVVRHTGFAELDPALGDPDALVGDEIQGWEGGLELLAGLAGRAEVLRR
jgi:uncharacterized protein YndB with AHSA1/START domain